MDWDLLKRAFSNADYTEFADKFVPEDGPPTSNLAPYLAFIVFISSVIGTFIYDIGYLLVGITICLLLLMIDSSLQMNYRLRKNGMIEADYFVGLSVGGFFVFVNMIIWSTYFTAIQFPITILISGLSFTVYELLLLTIIRVRLDTDTIYVEKHPKRPYDRYYVFTEEEYIPLLEESAMESRGDQTQ